MSQPPNIVFMLNDHQAYHGHGKMAGGPKIHRPNFEKLAKAGIEFSRAYTACPLCGPARRTMLTGLLPHNHGEIQNDVDHPFENETYLEKLVEKGYKNYYFGKWHAGPGTAHDHQCEGFSFPSYNNPYTKPEYESYIKKHDLPRFQVRIERLFDKPDGNRARTLGLKVGEIITPNGVSCQEHAMGIMTTPKETHEAFFLANLACDKLREIVTGGKKQPFHLRVDFWGPHQPYYVHKEFLDLYQPEEIHEYPNFRDDLKNKPKIYREEYNYPISNNMGIIYPNPLPWSEWQKVLAFSYAHTSLVDQAGGMILDTLEELGLSDNTIIVWATDHGDALACHGGHFDKACYMPEEMVRIPLTIKYPGKIPAGQKSDKLVSNMDLAPTFLDAAETSFGKPIDGKSLLPLCSQKNIDWREDLMCEINGHFINKHIGRLIVTNRYKYVWNDNDMDELYDLIEDPYELNNLINDNKHAELLVDMKTRLETWRQKTHDDMNRHMIRKILLRRRKHQIHMTLP